MAASSAGAIISTAEEMSDPQGLSLHLAHAGWKLFCATQVLILPHEMSNLFPPEVVSESISPQLELRAQAEIILRFVGSCRASLLPPVSDGVSGDGEVGATFV